MFQLNIFKYIIHDFISIQLGWCRQKFLSHLPIPKSPTGRLNINYKCLAIAQASYELALTYILS